MYRNWYPRWSLAGKEFGLASPPPELLMSSPGGAYFPQRHGVYTTPCSERQRGGGGAVAAAAGGSPAAARRRSAGAAGGESSAPGRRQGTKRTCTDSSSPPPEPLHVKRGRPTAAAAVTGGVPTATQQPDVVLLPYSLASDQIKKVFEVCRQKDSTYQKKLRLRDKVYRVIRNTFQPCELHIVGSSCTGFASDSSDMDVCLFLSDSWIDQQFRAAKILARVKSMLQREGDFQVNLILAKVPILRFSSVSTGIQVDLNCNNVVGIRNTHLLQCYAGLDDRVSPLILVVKLWAQSHDINDASRCTLSSYSLVLMVIHFLQCGVRPAVLPNLQRQFQDKFLPTQPVHKIPKQDAVVPEAPSANTSSLAHLFLCFLRYYACEFNFEVHVASVRTATRLYKYQCASVLVRDNTPRSWKFICVEEPFTRTNTARAVHKAEEFERILTVFMHSWRQLEGYKDLRFTFGTFGTNTLSSIL